MMHALKAYLHINGTDIATKARSDMESTVHTIYCLPIPKDWVINLFINLREEIIQGREGNLDSIGDTRGDARRWLVQYPHIWEQYYVSAIKADVGEKVLAEKIAELKKLAAEDNNDDNSSN